MTQTTVLRRQAESHKRFKSAITRSAKIIDQLRKRLDAQQPQQKDRST